MRRTLAWKRRLLPIALASLAWWSPVVAGVRAAEHGTAWKRRTIDNSSQGADGVRMANVNGDGLPDLVTPWEEGGLVRAYLNPGAADSAAPWPAVTVGRVRSPEDAVFVDLDADGSMDVVSCCEGDNRSLFVHWGPKDRRRFLDRHAWTTAAITQEMPPRMWMFALPQQIDGRRGIDLVAGARGEGAQVGWFESPADPRQISEWRWHPIANVGWLMSLLAVDVDHDGDSDVMISDRRGESRGCYWLENPGSRRATTAQWTRHLIGGRDREVMFLTVRDVDGDGRDDVACATRDGGILVMSRRSEETFRWSTVELPAPKTSGTGKGIAVGDLNLDGQVDLVLSCEAAKGRSGVMWFEVGRWPPEPESARRWHDISGTEGTKFDLLRLIDLDLDGDLDVITCEESENLGVVWYENPAR